MERAINAARNRKSILVKVPRTVVNIEQFEAVDPGSPSVLDESEIDDSRDHGEESKGNDTMIEEKHGGAQTDFDLNEEVRGLISRYRRRSCLIFNMQ